MNQTVQMACAILPKRSVGGISPSTHTYCILVNTARHPLNMDLPEPVMTPQNNDPVIAIVILQILGKVLTPEPTLSPMIVACPAWQT